MLPQERIHVAIVGAGITGLTLAAALNAYDLEQKIAVDLYESASELSEIGAGIIMWPRVWEIFQELGLGDTLTPLFDHYPDHEPRVVFEIRKADQKNGFKIVDVMKDGGALRIHRADLQRSLLQHLPLAGSGIPINSTCTLHLSHRLTDYELSVASPNFSSGSLKLYFADKANKTCDILVGADGIKSTVRRLFLTRLPDPEKYEEYLDPTWTGSLVYRGLVDAEELRKVYPDHRALNHPGIMYIGKGKHCVVYAISGGKHINVVGAVHDKSKEGTAWDGQWNHEVTQSEFYEHFVGWDDEFQALIRCIRRPMRWALQTLKHLNTFAKERVFLLGDSAHAMAPHLGAGAAVGIEDAYILASLLTHTLTSHPLSMQHIMRIAEIYNSIRVPQAIGWAQNSLKQGHLYGLHGAGFERFREGDDVPKEMLVELFESVGKIWSQTTPDANVDRKCAIRLLEGGAHL